MASPLLPPSNPHSPTNPAIFNRVPSWVSLNPPSTSSSLTKTDPKQTGVVENLYLISLSKQGKLKEAQEYINTMDTAGVPVNNHSYGYLFQACGKVGALSYGRFFHERIRIAEKKEPTGFLENYLLRMYSECGSLSDAQQVFEEMPQRNLVSWSTMIAAYALMGCFKEALRLFSDMEMVGTKPNQHVYASLIRACSSLMGLESGKQVHSHVIRSGLLPDALIESALCNMYAKCGSISDCRHVFDRIVEKNVISWSGLMVGYIQFEKEGEVLALFDRMLQEGVAPDQFVFSIVLRACCRLGDSETGRQIHGYIIKSGMETDVSTGTPLVDFYVKCGTIEEARRAFERISQPNVVSWSAMISGYSQMGNFEESLKLFKFLRRKQLVLSRFIYTSLFQACSVLADLNLGCQLHGDAIKRGLISDLYGESALVTMYSRSGSLEYARRVFGLIEKPDTVAWTAIICGCAYHGFASEALELFDRMQSSSVRPNSVTFVGVFTACSHSGLVSKAQQYLDSMRMHYSVKPTIDHYNCMVDIYCRAGQLNDGFELIKKMPFEPDGMTWKVLLGGCRNHRNVELGKIAGENLLQIEPKDTAAYVLLFNLYASAGRWEEAANIRKLMTERDVKKEVGCSWVVIKDKVHRFIVGDRYHPRTDAIYSKLEELDHREVEIGGALCKDNFLGDLGEKRKEQFLDHSEKLAIAFGLIAVHTKAPILVFKNLRVCSDCHAYTKMVSKVEGREIVVRDSIRFHHFKGGKCSCNDYW